MDPTIAKLMIFMRIFFGVFGWMIALTDRLVGFEIVWTEYCATTNIALTFLELSVDPSDETNRVTAVVRFCFFAIVVSGMAAVAIGVADDFLLSYSTLSFSIWVTTYDLVV
jgi:hypothetical protein